MTIDLTGCSMERKSGLNGSTLAGAYIAYKGLTGPLEPVNEGSFSALKVEIQEGNFMMARFPAVMASWSRMLPTVVDTILRALAPAVPGAHSRRAPRHTRRFDDFLRSRSAQFARVHPADDRRRRLGRTPVRGWRVRNRFRLPGRRAERSDRSGGAQDARSRCAPGTAERVWRRRQAPRRPRPDHGNDQPLGRPLERVERWQASLPALGPERRPSGRVIDQLHAAVQR